MHMFRYNPLFKTWVMIGSPISNALSVTQAHILTNGKSNGFVAATHPRHPFLLDPETKKVQPASERLYKDNPALGDYELLLYSGSQDFWEWDTKTWQNWILLVQQRLIQSYHNPHLHYAQFSFSTSDLDSIKGFQRVGDLVLTSHPLQEVPMLTEELTHKILSKELDYVIHQDGFGALYVPSAPTEDGEVWYLPQPQSPQIDSIGKDQRLATARILHKLFTALHHEYPSSQHVLHIYTYLSNSNEDISWFIRIHKKTEKPGVVPVHSAPEFFAQKLILGGHFRPVKS